MSVVLPPSQIVVLPLMDIVGSGLVETVTLVVAEQPSVLVAVTV